MKTYPELAAEGMKKTLFAERKTLTEADDKFNYEVSYLAGDFYLYVALETSKGTIQEELVRIKSGRDAAAAYQKFYNKQVKTHSDAGIYSFICIGRSSSEAKELAEVMSSEFGISYDDNNSPCFGLQIADEMVNSAKSKSEQYFKAYDGFMRAIDAVQKTAQSKKIEVMEKVFENYAKFKNKLSSPLAEYAELVEQMDPETYEITSDYEVNERLEFSSIANIEQW